jgi:hypothetical protein
MASLADLLDPDQWIMSGKNLLDFPWPEGNNEREALKLPPRAPVLEHPLRGVSFLGWPSPNYDRDHSRKVHLAIKGIAVGTIAAAPASPDTPKPLGS